jgi:hypothetical protein
VCDCSLEGFTVYTIRRLGCYDQVVLYTCRCSFGTSDGVVKRVIIIPPESPKPAMAPAPIKPVTVVDRLDRKLVEAISQPDDQPVPLWPLIHSIIEGEHPPDRTRRRQLCSRLLCVLRHLLRTGKIVRESKGHIRLAAPPSAPSPTSSPTAKPVRNLPPSPFPSVGDLGTFSSGGPRRKVFRV